MEWIALVLVALGGYYFGTRRKPAGQGSSMVISLERASAEDRSFLLALLRRELANYLIRHDPDRFLQVTWNANRIAADIAKATKDHQQARLKVITDQYPFFTDLDILAIREHVLYADAVMTIEHDALEAHYVRLVEFQSLLHSLDEHWSRFPAVSERDRDHLKAYVRKVKDTKLRQRILAAMKEFDAFRNGAGLASGRDYETGRISVCRVDHIMESRHGIHFKDTGEYGLYSAFYDSERDKSYVQCYRSNRTFREEIVLDHLRTDQSI